MASASCNSNLERFTLEDLGTKISDESDVDVSEFSTNKDEYFNRKSADFQSGCHSK